MDVLSIININLENFKVSETVSRESFKLSQICTICFKITDTLPLNKLVFQDQKLQDILESTTSCFNFKGVVENSEELILSCHMCLEQLLTSHLFQQKVQKAGDLFKTIIDFSIKQENAIKEAKNLQVFNEQQNDNLVKLEVVLATELSDIQTNYGEILYQNVTLDNSDFELNTQEDTFDNETEENDKNTRPGKKKESREQISLIAKKKKLKLINLNKTCPICSKVFKRHCKLKYHMEYTHSKEAQHQCRVCGRQFSWPENLKRHMLTHTGEKPYVCSECGKGFIQKQQLMDHKHLHTGEKLTCEICGKVCSTVSTFNRHMKNIHTESAEAKKPPIEGSTICDICGKTLSSKVSLSHHMLTHGEKVFACDRCDGKFTSKMLLITHTRIHTGEKPFACKECGKVFRAAASFYQHKRIHTGEKPHACHLCPKTFRQSQHLRYHLRVHSGIKEFACDECDRTFLTKGNLTQHKKTHTDEKPFACEMCGKTFAASNNLKKHKAVHQRRLERRGIEQECSLQLI